MIFSNIYDNERKIKEVYKNSLDINFRNINLKNNQLLLVFNQCLCNGKSINDFVLKNLSFIQKF